MPLCELHSHNPLVCFASRFTLKLFIYLSQTSAKTHTHTHPSDTILSSFVVPTSESPFTGPQEEGIYAKQAQCTNLTSTFTYAEQIHAHTYIHVHARCKRTRFFSPIVSQMKACQLLQQFYRRLCCCHCMQISNLLKMNSFPIKK